MYNNKKIITHLKMPIVEIKGVNFASVFDITPTQNKKYKYFAETLINFSKDNYYNLRKNKIYLKKILANQTDNLATVFIQLLNFWIDVSEQRYCAITRQTRLKLAIHLLTYLDKIVWPLKIDNIEPCKLLLTKALHIKTCNNQYYTNRSGISSK